ncbi:hypothetical protein Dimus_036989 [Dionaea muscipula]
MELPIPPDPAVFVEQRAKDRSVSTTIAIDSTSSEKDWSQCFPNPLCDLPSGAGASRQIPAPSVGRASSSMIFRARTSTLID